MKEWKEVQLGNVSDVQTGPFGSQLKNEQYITGGTPVVTVEHIRDFRIANFDYPSVPDEDKHRLSKYLMRTGDILFTRVGSVDLSAYVSESQDGWIFSSRMLRVRPHDEINSRFLSYYFQQKSFRDYILNISVGATMPSINTGILKSILISYPPLPEQKAIASVLSSLDDKIDLLHQQNQTLEALAETLFRQWFVEEAEDSWEEIEFGDFLTPQKGKNLTRAQAIDGPYPVVAGGLDPMCTHNMSNTEKPVITISASGANAGFIRLYNQKVWSSDSSFIDKKITPYVYFSYLFLKFNQEILFDRQTGSAQPHIYPKQIMELEFRNYPEHLIIEFDQWCEDLFEKIKFNQIQIQTLEKLRDTLLPKLMSGEVRVKKTKL